MSLAIPVVFIIFNRPTLARRVLASIAAARPRKLFVIADGPRPDHPGDAALCRETRALLNRIDWTCDVQTTSADINLGCRRRIASGLDWVFSQTDAAIVLEDDCLPTAEFFRFCEEALLRYRDDPRIHMVRGTSLAPEGLCRDSYYFSRFYNVWGWATWARAWQHYDVEMREWPTLRDTDWLERWLPTEVMARQMRYFFDETHAGRIDTWDYQWTLAGWRRDALAVTPVRNQVTNIGFDVAGTHERDSAAPLAALATSPMDFPLRHPTKVVVSETADFAEWRRVYSDPGVRRRPWQRLKQRMWRLLK